MTRVHGGPDGSQDIRPLARRASELRDTADFPAAVAALRDAFEGRPPAADPEAEALERAANAETEADARAVLAELWPGWPSLADAWDEPEPEAVLSGQGGTLAGVGEPLILTGPGGAGKSSLALRIAHAAGKGGGPCGDAGGGLLVRRGPVAVTSYEDHPARIAGRARWIEDKSEAWRHVRIWRDPAPLWEADPEDRRTSGPGLAWETWRRGIEGCSLAIVDPASVAFAGANPSDGAAVRAFLAAASSAAAEAGAGLAIVAHDTKAARFASAAGEGPGAGAVSGSAQWSDGARAVLHLSAALRPDVAAEAIRGGIEAEGCRVLRVAKANYARTGGGWLVRPECDDNWRGLRIATALEPERVARVDRAAGTKPPKGGTGRTKTGAT